MSDETPEKPHALRGTKRKKCPTCGKLFNFRASHAGKRKYCSNECRYADSKAGRAARKQAEAEAAAAAAITKLKAKKGVLTPTQSAEIRGQISTYMTEQINQAALVVLGQVEWSPVQARVFSTLLNKVIPDLSASYVQQETTPTDLTQMSREQLEALANQMRIIEGTAQALSADEDDIIDEVVSELHQHDEDRNAHS